MSFLSSQLVLPPPRLLEPPPLLSGDIKDRAVRLNRRMLAPADGNSQDTARYQHHAEIFAEPAIKLPAIRNLVSFLTQPNNAQLKATSDSQDTGASLSAPSCRQDVRHMPASVSSNDSSRAAPTPLIEPTFAKLLTAGRDMKTVLEAMDQELSVQDVLDLLRIDLARPPVPAEPISDPDYKPRASTITGRAPVDARHSKKETERRAQHKHYLDLSEIKIPDFFLKLCGWDEPNDSGSKKTPRTKSSVLQAGCLYTWFLSGPVLRCFEGLIRENSRLKVEMQWLANENCGLRWRCESQQLETRMAIQHVSTFGERSTPNPPSLNMAGFQSSSLSLAPFPKCSYPLQETSLPGNNHVQISLEHERSISDRLKSGKRRSSSVSSQERPKPTSPLKKRKTDVSFVETQGTAASSNFDVDTETSLPNLDDMGDQKEDDRTPTQIHRLRLSSAPSLQSTTPSCWDTASVTSTNSSWDHASARCLVDT